MSVIREIKALSRLQVSFMALLAAGTGVLGAAAGYKFAIEKITEQLREDADEALQKEIASVKEFYSTMYKKDEYETPEKALEKLHPGATPPKQDVKKAVEALLTYNGESQEESDRLYTEAIKEEATLRPVARNVFTNYQKPEFDYEAELEKRDPDRPYLITDEEFAENPLHYEQVNWTYYAGDGVLANSDESVVERVNDFVGDENLLRFGEGSNDENVVYVRNVKYGMDYEIIQTSAKYGEEVGGFMPDEDEPNALRHSHNPRKFRSYGDD